MPVIVNKKLAGKTETGIAVQLDPESLEQNDFVTVICDYSNCGDGNPTNIKWDQKSVAENLDALPKEAQKVLKMFRWDGTPAVFCSRKCLVNFLIDESEKEKAPITRNGFTLVKR